MPTSLRWIAARRDRSHPEYPPSFFEGRAIFRRGQASNEGAHSRAQGVASHDGSGYQSAVYFLEQALDELAGAIDASLPSAKKKVPRVTATVLVHQAWCTGPRPRQCATSRCG